MAEIAQATEQRGVVVGRDLRFAGNPGQQFRVGRLYQSLEFADFLLRQLLDRGIGEAAHDEVHLARAAMPGAEQKLAPALIQPLARPCGAAHQLPRRAMPNARGGFFRSFNGTDAGLRISRAAAWLYRRNKQSVPLHIAMPIRDVSGRVAPLAPHREAERCQSGSNLSQLETGSSSANLSEEYGGGRRRMRSAAFSAIMMTGALMLPPGRSGMTDASTTRRLAIPLTRSSASTTAISSPSEPILQVPAG